MAVLRPPAQRHQISTTREARRNPPVGRGSAINLSWRGYQKLAILKREVHLPCTCVMRPVLPPHRMGRTSVWFSQNALFEKGLPDPRYRPVPGFPSFPRASSRREDEKTRAEAFSPRFKAGYPPVPLGYTPYLSGVPLKYKPFPAWATLAHSGIGG